VPCPRMFKSKGQYLIQEADSFNEETQRSITHHNPQQVLGEFKVCIRRLQTALY
jgi:hypothetical protein